MIGSVRQVGGGNLPEEQPQRNEKYQSETCREEHEGYSNERSKRNWGHARHEGHCGQHEESTTPDSRLAEHPSSC